MKKIGIITFHRAHNYGAMLQAYALQNKITRMGHEVKIIDYRDKNIEVLYKILKFGNFKRAISSILNFATNNNRYKSFNDFLMNNMRLSKSYSLEQLKKEAPKYDIYIAGSDQVWNTDITIGLSDAYTLNFGSKSIKRISYAASIGKSNIESEKEIYKQKLKNIDNISVREESGKNILEPILEKEIDVVLDPTLLLTRKEWEEVIQDTKQEEQKYILVYVVEPDDEYVKVVNYLAKKTKLGVIHFGKKNIYNNTIRSAYTNGPLDFIKLIKNAEYVICTSFHATVFSIIFNKKFFVIPHKTTGARVTNLLSKLGIIERAVYTLDEFKSKDYEQKIEYESVNQKLEKERRKSIAFLKNAIED